MICFVVAGQQMALAAPVIEILPIGTVGAAPGDQLSFDVHLLNDDVTRTGWMQYAFGLYLDPAEVSYNNWTYSNEPDNWSSHMPLRDGNPDTPELDPLTTYDISNVYGSFNATELSYKVYDLAPGEDVNLGTITVDILNPVVDGKWDIAIKYDVVHQGDSFFFTGETGIIQPVQTAGPDVAPVPIPGAVWLLCSGLGMLGLLKGYGKRKD